MISDKNFKTYISNIDLKMQKFWSTALFHHYTDHGYEHSHRIIVHLEAILGDYPGLLNKQEQFILRASAYTHDIGMQSPLLAGLEIKGYLDYTWEEAEIVRKAHNISSSRMILESADDEFGLRDCGKYEKFIADVAKYHTGFDIALLEDTDHLGEEVKLPLLAALMRLGDALDLDYRRVNLKNLKRWDIPVESKFHWWAHLYVGSVRIAGGKISVRINFPEEYQEDPVLKPVLVEFEKKIKNSIDSHYNEVYEILYDYGIPLYRGVQIKTDYVKGRYEPIPQSLVDYVINRLGESAKILERTEGTPPSRIEANAILGIEHKNFEEIHIFLDELNTMLDRDFLEVKRMMYPDSWKIGLAYYDYEDNKLSYFLYPIPISRNDIQIKQITGKPAIRVVDTSHFVENPIKFRPKGYAVDIIESKMDRILENKLLNHKGSEFLAKEFVYAFTDHFYRQLGLESKDRYDLNNIEEGFHKFLPLWMDEAMKFLIHIQRNGIKTREQLRYRKPYFDPDMLTFQIFEEELITIDQNVRRRLERRDDFPSIILGNDKFPFMAFLEFLSFLKTKGVEKINRVYSPKDFTRLEGKSGLKYNLLSPNAVETNLKIFFDNLPEVYEEIVSNNFPRIKGELKIFGDVTKTIVTFNAKDSYEGPRDSPSFLQFNLKAEKPTGDYEIQVYRESDDALPKNLSWDYRGRGIEINGVNYKIISRRLSVLDFIFDDLPMFNFLYNLITDNLKRHFNSLRSSGPKIQSSVIIGLIGDKIEINGTAFSANNNVSIYFDFVKEAALLNKAKTDGDGKFKTAITIPNTSATSHYLWAKDEFTGISTHTLLQVVATDKVVVVDNNP